MKRISVIFWFWLWMLAGLSLFAAGMEWRPETSGEVDHSMRDLGVLYFSDELAIEGSQEVEPSIPAAELFRPAPGKLLGVNRARKDVLDVNFTQGLAVNESVVRRSRMLARAEDSTFMEFALPTDLLDPTIPEPTLADYGLGGFLNKTYQLAIRRQNDKVKYLATREGRRTTLLAGTFTPPELSDVLLAFRQPRQNPLEGDPALVPVEALESDGLAPVSFESFEPNLASLIPEDPLNQLYAGGALQLASLDVQPAANPFVLTTTTVEQLRAAAARPLFFNEAFEAEGIVAFGTQGFGFGGGGGFAFFNSSQAAVPEPTTLAYLALVLGGLSVRRYFKAWQV